VLHESMAGSPLITRTLREWRLTVRDVSTIGGLGQLLAHSVSGMRGRSEVIPSPAASARNATHTRSTDGTPD
jgi:hypothetical protein